MPARHPPQTMGLPAMPVMLSRLCARASTSPLPLSDEHIAQVIALPQSTIAAWRLQRQQGFDLKMKLSTLRAPGCRCCAVSAAVCVALEHGGGGDAGEGDAGGDVIWVRLARIGAGNLRRGSKSLGDA